MHRYIFVPGREQEAMRLLAMTLQGQRTEVTMNLEATCSDELKNLAAKLTNRDGMYKRFENLFKERKDYCVVLTDTNTRLLGNGDLCGTVESTDPVERFRSELIKLICEYKRLTELADEEQVVPFLHVRDYSGRREPEIKVDHHELPAFFESYLPRMTEMHEELGSIQRIIRGSRPLYVKVDSAEGYKVKLWGKFAETDAPGKYKIRSIWGKLNPSYGRGDHGHGDSSSEDAVIDAYDWPKRKGISLSFDSDLVREREKQITEDLELLLRFGKDNPLITKR